MADLLDLHQDPAVALLRRRPLGGIAAARLRAEQLLENILQIHLGAPAELEREGHCHGVAVIDLGEQIRVAGVVDPAAHNPRECVAGQGRAHARSAARDNKVRRARVQQQRRQQARLHIGALVHILRRIAAIVVAGVPHGLSGFFQRLKNQFVFGCLAVFVDQCDLHCHYSFSADCIESIFSCFRKRFQTC